MHVNLPILATLFISAVLACQHEVTMSWMHAASRESSWPPAYSESQHTIYSVQTGSGVVALADSTGVVRWSVDDADVVGGPALSGGNVFVAKVGALVSFNVIDGSFQSQFSLESSEVPCRDGAPVVADGKIYFGTSAGKVYALDAATLSSVWTADLGATNGVSAPVSLWNGFVVAGTFSGNVFLIASDGSIARSYSTPNVPEYSLSDALIFGIQTRIAVVGDMAYYGTNTDTNHLIALDLVSMTAKWRVTLSENTFSTTSHIISGNVLFTTTMEGDVFAVDITSGRVIWTVELGERADVRGPLSLLDGSLIVTTSAGSVAGIYTSNAISVDWWFNFNAAGMVYSTVLNTEGANLVISGDSMIYPLQLSCRA